MPTNTTEHVRIPQNMPKSSNSLGRSAETRTEEPERLRNPSGASDMHTHTHEHSDRIGAKQTVKTA